MLFVASALVVAALAEITSGSTDFGSAANVIDANINTCIGLSGLSKISITLQEAAFVSKVIIRTPQGVDTSKYFIS